MATIPQSLLDKIIPAADIGRRDWKNARPMVFTNGVFDLLHSGHVLYLAAARELGATLLVAVNSDGSARQLAKGPERPLNSERDRALVIAALRHHQPVLSGTIPDTGTLRGDVLAVLRRASGRITETGPGTVIGMLSDLLSDDEGAVELIAQLTRGGDEVMTDVLDRAAARGEIRDDISPRVARLPIDLLRHELILTQQPPSQRALEEIVDDIFLPLVLRDP